MWFPWLYFIVLTFRLFCVPAQSIDEEEAVHLVEGSGNYASDDEDIEGSSLPPDAHYATTPPVMHPRFTHSTTTRRRFDSTLKYTTLIKSQRVTTFATSTPSIITHPRLKDTSARGKLFSTSTTVIILGLLVLLLIGIMVAVVCFTCCNRTKAYRPGEDRRSEALLNSPQSR